MKAQVLTAATAYASGTQWLLDALAFQLHRVGHFITEVIRGRHPILSNPTFIRVAMLAVAVVVLGFVIGSHTAFADGVEARVPESPVQAKANAVAASSAADACHYLTFCRWGQGSLANAPTPSIGFSSSPAMLLNVGSSTLATWVFSAASFAVYGIGMLLMYATNSGDFIAPLAAIIDKMFSDIMGVFTGTELDITGLGTMTSLFGATMVAAIGFWVSKIIVGFLSTTSPYGVSLGRGLKALFVVLMAAAMLILISNASAKNHEDDVEVGQVAGGDPVDTDSWEPMSAGWLIIGAQNGVRDVTNSLNDGLLGITGGIIDDGISSGSSGNDTCYAYTNSIRNNGFKSTAFSRDSKLGGESSGVVMQYDQLMYQVYFKLYQLSAYGSTQSATNSWCRYGETNAGISLGEVAYFNAGAKVNDDTYGQYNDIFGSFIPSDQEKAEATISYEHDGILVNDDGSWKTDGDAKYRKDGKDGDVTKNAKGDKVQVKQAIVAMSFLTRSSSIADRNYWAVCTPNSETGESSVNKEWSDVILYNKLTTQVNNRNTNVFGYAQYMFGQLKDKLKDMFVDVEDPTVGKFPELCQAPWAIPGDLQKTYEDENAGYQEIKDGEEEDKAGVQTQDAGGNAPFGWNDVRGTNLAAQVISFTGLVGSGDMKSEWHFAQSVMDTEDKASAVGAQVGDNPALTFYQKSQGLSTAFLLLYAVIVLALVGYFSKIMIPIIISAFIASIFLALTILLVFFSLVAMMFYTENSFARFRKMVTKFVRALLIGFFITLMLSIAVMAIALSVKAMSFIPDLGQNGSTAFIRVSLAMIVGSAIATWIFKNFMGIDMTNGLKTAVSSTMSSLTGEDELKGMFKGNMFGQLAPQSKKLGDAATDRMGGLIDSLFGKNRESNPWGDQDKTKDPNEHVNASDANTGSSSATGNAADALLAGANDQQGQLGAGSSPTGLLTAGSSGDGDGGGDLSELDPTKSDSKGTGKELVLAPAVAGDGLTELAKNESPRKGSELADSASSAMQVQRDSMASHDRLGNPDQLGTNQNPFKPIPGEVLDRANRDSYGASKSDRSTRENAGSAFTIADNVNRSDATGLGDNSIVTQMATTSDRFAGMRPITKEQIDAMPKRDRERYLAGDLNSVRIPGTSEDSQYVYAVPESRPGFVKDNYSGMYVPNSVVSDTNGQVSQKVSTSNGSFVGVTPQVDGRFAPNIDYDADSSMKPVFSGQAPKGVEESDWSNASEVEQYAIQHGTNVEQWPEEMQRKFDIAEAKAPELLGAVSSGVPPVTNREFAEQAPGIMSSDMQETTGRDLAISMSGKDEVEPFDANHAPNETQTIVQSDRGYENLDTNQYRDQKFEPLSNGLDEYARERAALVKSRTDLASENAKMKLSSAFEGVEARHMQDIAQYDSLSDSITTSMEGTSDLDLSGASESMSRLDQIRSMTGNQITDSFSEVADSGTEFYQEAGQSAEKAGSELHHTFVEGRHEIANSLGNVRHDVDQSIDNLSQEMHRLESVGIPEDVLDEVREAGIRMESIQRDLGDSIYMFTQDYERGAEEISQMFQADLDRQLADLDSVRNQLSDSLSDYGHSDDIMDQVREIRSGVSNIRRKFFG